MAAYSLKRVQQIPVSLDKAWAFFSDPRNLETITPADMKVKIISRHHGEKMYAGQIIEYKLKPLSGIPFYWMTEITQVKDREYFIDVQLHGPYKQWHHQHFFKAIPGGVEMTDIVHYKLPLWVFGRLAATLFINRKIRRIFDYRYKKIEEIFGKWPASGV